MKTSASENNSIFKKFPVIESNEMILRQLKERDDLELTDLFDYDMDERQAKLYIHMADTQFHTGKSILMGIEEKQSSKLVGVIQLQKIKFPEAEIGYRIKKKYRRQHYGTKAVMLLSSFLAERFHFERICAVVQMQNAASIKLLENCGFVETKELEDSLIFVKFL